MRVPLVYKPQPILGFDIGPEEVKLMQLEQSHHGLKVAGYGSARFSPDVILEGIISDPQAIAQVVKPLLEKAAVGKLSARRVAASLPVAKTFVRTIELPPMTKTELSSAIKLQSEQYIPVPVNDLYIDYTVIGAKPVDPKTKDAPQQEILLVATPRAIVDSYIQLFDLLELEVEVIEISLAALARAAQLAVAKTKPVLIINFGAQSIDLAVLAGVIRVTGSVSIGTESVIKNVEQKLGLTNTKSRQVITKLGLGASDLLPKIKQASADSLDQVAAEAKRVTNYFKDHSGNRAGLEGLILTGDGAAVPGLADYLAQATGLAALAFDPWDKLTTDKTPKTERAHYHTAIGLAMKGLGYD